MKILCVLLLLTFLSPRIIFASNKFEAGLFFGSYRPSFSRANEEFYGLNLSIGKIQGYSLSYQVLSNCNIRVEIAFSEHKSHCPYSEVDIRLKTTIVSVLGMVDLFQYPKHKLYTGMGLTDYQVTSPRYAKHDFGFPRSVVILLGVAVPLHKSCQLKVEGQYVIGVDGELFRVPLDWNGFKFLMSLGIKF